MSRGLTTAMKTALDAESVECFHLVRLDFTTPLYYTNAPYDITYDGKNFISTPLLGKLPKANETLKIKPNSFDLVLGGSTTATHAITLSDFVDVDAFIYLYVVGAATATLLWQGYVASASSVEDLKTGESSITLRLANNWSNWEDINNRLLDNDYQQQLFASDVGLEYYNITEYFLQYWGETYSLGSEGGFISGLLDRVAAENFEKFKTTTDALEETAASVPVLYGERDMRGIPVFRALSGTRNEYLWVVYVLAEGECNALVDIKFNGTSYTDAALSPYISVWFHAGTDAQAADSNLVAAAADWTVNHRLRGLCYCVVRYTKNAVWGDGEPQPEIRIQGKKLYDPRTTLTAYSSNPALVLYDYLTDTRIGKGLSSTLLSGVNAAADYCDALVTDHDGGAGGTPVSIKRFDCQGYLNTGQSIKKNVEAILFTMRGHLPWANGLYHFTIERHDDTSVYSFDEDNLSDKFQLSHEKKLNEVHYRYVDLEMDDNDNTIVEASAAYLTLDNNKVLKKTYRNNFENNQYRAKNRAATILKKSRESVRIELNSARLRALDVIAGDLIDVTRPTQGWTSKLFRVTDLRIEASGRISMKAEEYEATVYDWNVSVESPLPSDTDLLNPFIVTGPTSLVLTSGTAELLLQADGTVISRIKASWTAPADDYYAGINVYLRHDSWTDYILVETINDKNTNEAFISPVEDGELYWVRVASFNSLGVESSLLQDSITVVGKTAPPSDVVQIVAFYTREAVILKWTQVPDADLAGYEIRYGDVDTGCCWDASTILTEVTRGTNVTTVDIPPGTWTIYIKAVDTSGNYSVNAASTTLTISNERTIVVERYENRDWDWIGNVLANPDNILANNQDLTLWTKVGTPTVVENTTDIKDTFYSRRWDVTDNSAVSSEEIYFDKTTEYTHGQEWTAAVFIDFETGGSTCEVILEFLNGAVASTAQITCNAQTGATVTTSSNATVTTSGSQSTNGWFIWISAYTTTTGTDSVRIRLKPKYVPTETGTRTFEEPTLVRGQWDDPNIANFVLHPNGLVPKSMSLASLNGWDVFDVAVVDPYNAGRYRTQQIQLGFDSTVRVWTATLHRLMTLDSGNAIEYINKSFDYILWGDPQTAWDAMEPWEIGFATFGYGMAQIDVGFGGGMPVIEEYIITMDKDPVFQSGQITTVASINNTVNFDPRFHLAPDVTAIVNTSSAHFAVIREVTATSFKVAVYDTTGAVQAATVDWTARGV